MLVCSESGHQAVKRGAGDELVRVVFSFLTALLLLEFSNSFFSRNIVKRMQKHHAKLTRAQVALLPGGAEGIKTKLANYDAALKTNQRFFDRVLLHIGEAPSALTTNFDPRAVKAPAYALGRWQVPPHHANKLSGTLHALSRDWAREGRLERSEAYGPILAALKARLPLGSTVLVPGSGLARLTCEIAARGFKSQGNDFDFFMLFTADFMLNGIAHPQEEEGPGGPEAARGGETKRGSWRRHEVVTVHPWVHSLTNNLSHDDALRPIKLPDVSALNLLENASDEEAEEGGLEGSFGGAASPGSGPPAPPSSEERTAKAAPVSSAAAAPPLPPFAPPGAGQKERAVLREARAAFGDLSMCAGEFLLAYDARQLAAAAGPEEKGLEERSGEVKGLGEWDAFVSCFFVDTAPNVLEYIALVKGILRPGGVWVNFGPLTYHWADPFSELGSNGMTEDGCRGMDERYSQSLELSWEEIRHALQQSGFQVEEERRDVPAHYTLNEPALMRTQYRCVFFTAVLRAEEE
eukprot:CAMPEP_0172596318 /NCGR_PEP_ID=MMETSP1068-20121228/16080_1 /TAXON_ID=35684 /ORGANISM="Pseudopedinella elastica, Strain CCMP716" /LENGTH=520 /DNA_ID=CAMNT_0013395279 /DNA_START=27 /DNA_END=1589 /DNA_ORIENTATION=-